MRKAVSFPASYRDYRVSIYCPHCKQRTALDLARAPWKGSLEEGYTPALWIKNNDEIWWIGICGYCDNPVLVLNEGDKVYPTPLPSLSDERIPETIRALLDEAKLCFSVRAYNACAVMARKALQQACIDKGATQNKRLVNQIDELASQGAITEDLKEWAHTVRWVGNDAAHPSSSQVNKEDAQDVLYLAEQFLHILYVTPQIAAEQAQKRGKQI